MLYEKCIKSIFNRIVSCKGKEKVVEKTTFDVVLTDVGTNKLGVVKVVKLNTELTLNESKDLLESAPKTVKTGLTKELTRSYCKTTFLLRKTEIRR